MLCQICNQEIPKARAEFLQETDRPPTCVKHSTEGAVVGYSVYPHKTGSTCVVVKPEDEEALRRAQNAHRREM
jgi:hypothetical protein